VWGLKSDGGIAASLTKPAAPDRWRHAGRNTRVFTRGATGDLLPEPLTLLAQSNRRPTR
jgi:hypothetical protein